MDSAPNLSGEAAETAGDKSGALVWHWTCQEGHQATGRVWVVIDALLRPELVSKAISEELNPPRCPECDEPLDLRSPLGVARLATRAPLVLFRPDDERAED